MFPRFVMPAMILAAFLVFCHCGALPCLADDPAPHAPANLSWLPHGSGGDMWVVNTNQGNMKSLHGFRVSPAYIGCWSSPVWGCDVNGFWAGPNVPSPDPVSFQLPIGLIYPENSPPMPPTATPTKVKPQASHR